ncbi:MAG: hypothetical protein J6K96_02780 [Treponema sp.]|nr:hypothetical protein [Treponema sp.]
MITLKILDDKDAELELLDDDYVSVIPEELQWRAWAADSEGMTGDALKEFVDTKLFPACRILLYPAATSGRFLCATFLPERTTI